MSDLPRLSILALCYRHEKFLDEALHSIQNLHYPNLEVWIADDASDDLSVEILHQWKEKRPDWNFVFQPQNLGNCRTFNLLLRKATGKYILDFATDDVLVRDQMASWIGVLESNPDCGFCYADAWIFHGKAEDKYLFSSRNRGRGFPEGRILPHLFMPSFICPPAVLFRTSALESIGGYDEGLAYEDWDVWLRLARKFPVCRIAQPVIWYRKHKDSMSASLFRHRNERHLNSTIAILKRILEWEELREANPEIVFFVEYHLRLATMLQLPEQAKAFYGILRVLKRPTLLHRFYLWLSGSGLPVYWLLRLVYR